MAKRSQAIVDDYLHKIVSGELGEGQVLPTETALIQRYGVSRTAVREAIQALASKGFVSIRQGSGSTVAPRSSWHVLDADYLQLTGGGTAIVENLVETRDMLEPAIAGLAAARASKEQVQALRRIGAELAEAINTGRPVQEWSALDVAFHHALAECTGNPVLVSIHGSLSLLAQTHRAPEDGSSTSLQRALFWHEHIIEAVAAGDSAAAQDAMRMLLRESRA